MHFLNTIASALLLAGAAVAVPQMSSAPMPGTMASGSMSDSTTVNVHVVTVSNSTGKKLAFSPNNIQAAVGDMVQFQFTGGVSHLLFAVIASRLTLDRTIP